MQPRTVVGDMLVIGVSVILAVAMPFGTEPTPQIATVENVVVASTPQPAPSAAAFPEVAPIPVAATAPPAANAAPAPEVKRGAAVQRKRQNRKQYAAWGRDYYPRYARSYTQRSPASW